MKLLSAHSQITTQNFAHLNKNLIFFSIFFITNIDLEIKKKKKIIYRYVKKKVGFY